MGTYIYSLRAKALPLVVDTAGTIVTAHLYSYAYRYTSMWRGDYGYNSYKLTEANAERNARAVFGDGPMPFVIVGDLKDGLDGHSVYANVTAPLWYDCEKFPGTLIGWVRKVGKRYHLADRTEWSTGVKELRGDRWVPISTRLVMVDGKATQERVDVEGVATQPGA
jgi:hypothetical protein